MISVLVAYTKKDRVIGNRGEIPWKIPSERTRFKAICNDRFIIMGRKTFDEIGHSLPYCTIIIISKTLKNAPEGCLLAKSLEDGITMAIRYSSKAEKTYNTAENIRKNLFQQEILVAGGGEIYRQALVLPKTEKIYVTKVYATEIDAQYEGDVTFPKLENYGIWKKTEEELKKDGEIDYKYVTYERI